MQNRHKGFLMSKNKKVDNVDTASGIDSFDELTTLISNSGLLPEHKELFSALCNMGSDLLKDIIVLDKQIKKAEHSRSKEGKEFLNVKATSEEDLKKMIEKILLNNAKFLALQIQQDVLKEQFTRITSIIGKHIENLENNYGEDK